MTDLGKLERNLIRFLAYQHRLLSDKAYDPEFDDAERDKFKTFLKTRLGFDIDEALAEAKNKTIRFSYPDLYQRNLSLQSLAWLKEVFHSGVLGASLDNAYIVYVKHDAPQIGFTVAVVFEMSLNSSSSFEELFVPLPKDKPKFHKEFRDVWLKYADKPQTLPVVIFEDQSQECFLWRRDKSSTKTLCGTPVRVELPSGRTVHLERGFPYVSYVIHSTVSAAIPAKIHRCDFALLMALPGFVEGKLEAMVQRYRSELAAVQQGLDQNDFLGAGKKYSLAWNSFERVQGIAPRTRATVQRILQKYSERSLFAVVANDNAELIQYTVNAAIEATQQVRANIQSLTQQGLQQSVNNLQKLTMRLTAILAAGAVGSILIALFYTTSTNTSIVDVKQPVWIEAEPAPDESLKIGSPQMTAVLNATALSAARPEGQIGEVLLVFHKNVDELRAEVPTPMAISGKGRLEILLLVDGAVLGKDSIASETTPAAIQFRAKRKWFVTGRKYYVQVQQDPFWRIRLPINFKIAK